MKFFNHDFNFLFYPEFLNLKENYLDSICKLKCVKTWKKKMGHLLKSKNLKENCL